MKKLSRRERILRYGTVMGSCVALAIMIILALCTSRQCHSENPEPLAEGCTWTEKLTNASAALPELKPIDRTMERFMQQWGIKGLQLAIVRNDSLVYTQGYGWADLEASIPMEATTIMRIASASKLVTAIAAMKLIEEGRMSLDSKIFGPGGILTDIFPDSIIADPRAFDITVDHLLLHQGGFSRWMGDPMFRTADIMKAQKLTTPPTHEKMVEIVMNHRLSFAPGASRRYSNFGYMLLSLAIEKASGTDYWQYVREHVLEPAGACGLMPAGNYYADRHPSEARYYPPDSSETVEEYNGSGRMVPRVYGGSDINALLGAGGWTASAAELARLVAAIDTNPAVPDILSAESIATLTENAPKEKLARGWVDADSAGNWVRTGTLASTHAFIKRFANGEIWVMLTNSGVWTGHSFSHQQARVINDMASRYHELLPHRSLW